MSTDALAMQSLLILNDRDNVAVARIELGAGMELRWPAAMC